MNHPQARAKEIRALDTVRGIGDLEVAPMSLVSSVRIEKFGNREHVFVFLRGSCVGTLIVDVDDGRALAEKLIPRGRWLVEQVRGVDERRAVEG